jgi:ring-1,2-phenylacetyl-CoA epoxidase subunit PaaD
MVNSEIIWKYLDEVADPEIPVLSIIDLGVVRDVVLNDNSCLISITPTYSGCPAMKHIENQIIETLALRGYSNIEVKHVLSPAWTTDWISDSGKAKLLEYGIAPPVDEVDKSILFADAPKVNCPKCGSSSTRMVSLFGSTACKAQYQCKDCLEPFDYFKCLK